MYAHTKHLCTYIIPEPIPYAHTGRTRSRPPAVYTTKTYTQIHIHTYTVLGRTRTRSLAHIEQVHIALEMTKHDSHSASAHVAIQPIRLIQIF